ncbi:MAG: HAMP domain-containing histidine kinase [Candidatus Marinimicrobia bacterium]|nr:HAMP domain-containing histidine kinase [Candidatus Neomarinimicrobiota bacterium]
MDKPAWGKITTDIKHSFYTPGSLRRKNDWLIKLRWIAVGAALVYAFLVKSLLPEVIPLGNLLYVIAALGVINFLYFRFVKVRPPESLKNEEKLVSIQITTDLILLSFLIHFSGGLENPFNFFYIFHIIIAATIFEKPTQPFFVAIGVAILFTFLTVAEFTGLIHHYQISANSYTLIQLTLALLGFYVTIFVSSYIGVTLMNRHRKVKNLIYTQNEELKKASETKMKFFRFVSHELKSPIVAVQSSINVIIDIMGDQVPEKALDMLERARVRTRQMLAILKDLVDLSYDRPVSKNQGDLVNPCDYLGEFIDNERPRADEQKIQIIQNICSEKGDLKIDRFVLEKIFSNLLSNAIRYTPAEGTVTIETAMDNYFWSFMIIDTGIGMSKADQVHIFEEFYRAENAKKFATIGTGLGLNIVKKMVENLGGYIELDSKIDHGTTIIVRIPVNE